MRKLRVFESISIDGYSQMPATTSAGHTMPLKMRSSPNWISANATSGGDLVLGRKTYEMMEAIAADAKGCSRDAGGRHGDERGEEAYVVSRTIRPTWNNTHLLSGNVVQKRKGPEGERRTGHHDTRQRQHCHAVGRSGACRWISVRRDSGCAGRWTHCVH